MLKTRKLTTSAVAVLILAMLFTLTGCESSSVSMVVFSDNVISDEKTLGGAASLEKAPAGKDLYANVMFIESPEGMKYNVKWICNGSIVKEEEKMMTTSQKGIISYFIEGVNFKKGSYSFEIYYKDKKIHEEKVMAE